MARCELCSRRIAAEDERLVADAVVKLAVQMGYDPLAEAQSKRPVSQLRESFGILLTLHGPTWALCDSCRALVESYAAREVPDGPRRPELIRILGNGFQPAPQQWRVMLGGWLDKWEKNGIEMNIHPVTIQIETAPKAPIGDFIEAVPMQRERLPEQLVDALVLRDREAGADMIILVIWSMKDSPAMRKLMRIQ
jgi:hypothetical protein